MSRRGVRPELRDAEERKDTTCAAASATSAANRPLGETIGKSPSWRPVRSTIPAVQLDELATLRIEIRAGRTGPR